MWYNVKNELILTSFGDVVLSKYKNSHVLVFYPKMESFNFPYKKRRLIKMPSPIKFSLYKLSIFKLLLMLCLLLVITIISVLSIFFYYQYCNFFIEKTNKQIINVLNEINNNITSIVDTAINISFSVANDDFIKQMITKYKHANIIEQLHLDQDVESKLSQVWFLKPEIYNINIFLDGKKYAGNPSNSVYPLSAVKDLPWFRSLGRKRGVLIDTHLFGFDTTYFKNSYVIRSLVRIQNKSENDLGFVSVEISEDYLYRKLLAPNKVTENSNIFMVNRNGKVLAAAGKSKLLKKIDSWEFLRTVFANPKRGYIRFKWNGEDVLCVYSPESKINWRVVEMIPVKELYTGMGVIKSASLLGIIITLGLAFPLAWFLSVFISRPITALARSMEDYQVGAETGKVKTKFRNEIGELYQKYNFLTQRIVTLMENARQTQKAFYEAEIKALQAQVNPHFLYNTLNSVNWMALNIHAHDISLMITMLSRLLRLTFRKGHFHTIGEEIEHLRYYLDIQKIRYKNRFEYDLNFDETARDCLIPALTMQPIVENSLVHGFENMSGGGIITIEITRKNDLIFIDIQDNGSGIPEEVIAELVNSENGHFGIKSVNDRIRYLCGEAFGIEYQAGLSTGTHACIKLPAKLQPDLK